MVGVKWASHDVRHYTRVLRLFADRFNFIDNMLIFSLSARLGAKGFIDFYANAAPRLSLRFYQLLQAEKYNEFDELWLKMRFDPFIKVVSPEQETWVGMGEGPTSRMSLRLLGMETGPPFPAQATPSGAYVQRHRQAIEASGILEWVDWDQSVFDKMNVG